MKRTREGNEDESLRGKQHAHLKGGTPWRCSRRYRRKDRQGSQTLLIMNGLSSDRHPLMLCGVRLINGTSISYVFEFPHSPNF